MVVNYDIFICAIYVKSMQFIIPRNIADEFL